MIHCITHYFSLKTKVDLERTLVRCDECEVEIQELEDDLKIVGQNMKTLELSETDALARQESMKKPSGLFLVI